MANNNRMASDASALVSLNYWLPQQLRSLDDQALAIQARFFVIFALTYIPMMSAIFFILLGLSYFDVLDLYPVAAGACLVIAVQTGSLIYLKKTANVQISTLIFSIICFIATFAIMFLTGGWDSQALSFLLALFVMICLFVNRGLGIFYSVLTLIVYVTFFVLDHNGYVVQTLIILDQHVSAIIVGLLQITTLLAIVACLLLYEHSTTQLASAIEQDRLQLDFDAHYDTLTQIYNKQALLEQIDNLLQMNTQFSVTFIKVENLADVNNQFGYDFGDAFIKGLADNIKLYVTQENIFARYSPNTFVFISKYITNLGQMINKVCKLRAILTNAINLDNGVAVLPSCRIGTLLASGNNGLTIEEIIASAREAYQDNSSLYRRI